MRVTIAGFGAGSDVVTRLPKIWPASGDIGVWTGLSETSLIAEFAFIGFAHLVNVAQEIRGEEPIPQLAISAASDI